MKKFLFIGLLFGASVNYFEISAAAAAANLYDTTAQLVEAAQDLKDDAAQGISAEKSYRHYGVRSYSPVDRAKELLQEGATPNARYADRNPILAGAGYKLTKLLLEFGADPFMTNSAGLTARQVAENMQRQGIDRKAVISLLSKAEANWEATGRAKAQKMQAERRAKS